MNRKVVIKGHFGTMHKGGWTRSFPPGSVTGGSWMLDVVEDLKAYAAHHDMEEAEQILADTQARLSRVVFTG
ncbi:hypothetical protein [Pseudooceanicola marinus]|uniref:hypothetical protein n=1 Tax=Pseudooceanicola marinus TaxID=396013 RepID=UPI001C94CB85|nr:hypothetical protein [Pseudooceanicola marinus]MBY5971948.1 hypothetical protein [Ferrimonas balearica]MCA1335052.1 hypothetical protein [Pseudooceanicola marinus]